MCVHLCVWMSVLVSLCVSVYVCVCVSVFMCGCVGGRGAAGWSDGRPGLDSWDGRVRWAKHAGRGGCMARCSGLHPL